MSATTETRGVFKVERNAADTKWTITEDGDFNCPIEWGRRADALDTLKWIKEQAEKVVRAGYFQPNPHTGREIAVYIDGNRTELVLDYGFTAKTRRDTIRWAAMQYFVERASA